MTFTDPHIERVLRDGLRREGWPKPARHHPADRGGLTRGGITAVNWGDYKRLGRPATAEELNAITEDEALAFYFDRYVLLPHFDQITDQKLRALLVDWAFTSWWDDPTKALQSSLKARGLYDGNIDGVLGPKTKDALFRDRDPRQLYRDVYTARGDFYVTLALTDPMLWRLLKKADPDGIEASKLQIHNLRGWLNRHAEGLP